MADTTKPNSLMENYWRRVREEATKSGLLRAEPDRNVFPVTESNKYIKSAKKRFKMVSEGKTILFGRNGFIGGWPGNRGECTRDNLLYATVLEMLGERKKAEEVLENTMKTVGFGKNDFIGGCPGSLNEYTEDNLLHAIVLAMVGKKDKAGEVLENTKAKAGFGVNGFIWNGPEREEQYTMDTLLLIMAELAVGGVKSW